MSRGGILSKSELISELEALKKGEFKEDVKVTELKPVFRSKVYLSEVMDFWNSLAQYYKKYGPEYYPSGDFLKYLVVKRKVMVIDSEGVPVTLIELASKLRKVSEKHKY